MVVVEGSWEFFLGFGFWLVGFGLSLGCLSFGCLDISYAFKRQEPGV